MGHGRAGEDRTRHVRGSEQNNDSGPWRPLGGQAELDAGNRNYFLYGVWRWVTIEEHAPAIREKIRQLRDEIKRMESKKPEGWEDLSSRYAAAIEDLQAVIAEAESSGKR